MIRKRLLEIMKRDNLRQVDVIRRTGLSRGMVSKLVNGEVKTVNSVTLDKLATGLGVSAIEFMEGEIEPDTRWTNLGKQFEETGISVEWVAEFLGLLKRKP